MPWNFSAGNVIGTLLSAMCVPDLKGSQGTFSYYSNDEQQDQGDRQPRLREHGQRRGGVADRRAVVTVLAGREVLRDKGGDRALRPFRIAEIGQRRGKLRLRDGRLERLGPGVEILARRADLADPGLGQDVEGIGARRRLFPAEIAIAPVILPQLGELELVQFQAEGHWLTLGWRLP